MNGTHFGIFQLHSGFWGSVVAGGAAIGHRPNWYDPWANAYAASVAYGSRGSFRANWRGSVVAGCP